MKATENDFAFMLHEAVIEIPFFQRAYVWKEEQWEQLFEDLKESFKNKKEHFLGSIVLKQLQTNVGEGTKRSLIDGQQRLSTFSILVKSLYDKLDDNYKGYYANYLFQMPPNNNIPKIQHSKIDRASFEKILKAKNYKELSDYNKNDKLIECYQYFSEKIEQCEELKDFKSFLDFILHIKLWVTINLESTEDEQKIFDSINTAGLKLNATDIIKNALFAKAIALKADYEELYKKYWEDVFESEENKNFWEEELNTGRLKRTQSEIFLHAFAIIRGFFKPEDSLENLSKIYKEEIENYDIKKMESFLKQIKEYAIIYRNFPQIKQDTCLSFENDEERLFHILKITDTNTIMPLILKLKYSFKNDTLKSCFFLLERFVLLCWLCRKGTKDYNILFAKTIKCIAENKDNPVELLKEQLSERIPKDEDIKECLVSLKDNSANYRAKLILFWIELYRRDQNKGQDIIELSYQYTLEHIMPRSWEGSWKNIAKDKEHAEDLIYQIGNMTLLKGSLNSTIKNAPWKTKLNGDGSRKNSIKTCADLLITREILDKKKWDEESIKERTQRFIKDIFEIWGEKI